VKEYFPQGEIVGEDYHKLFLTDFAPYLEKIKVPRRGRLHWGLDSGRSKPSETSEANGIMLPFAHIFLDEPNFLHEVGLTERKVSPAQPVWTETGIQNTRTNQIL